MYTLVLHLMLIYKFKHMLVCQHMLFANRNQILWNIFCCKNWFWCPLQIVFFVVINSLSTEKNHGQNFLVKNKNNLKFYKIKNNGENIVEFYTTV